MGKIEHYKKKIERENLNRLLSLLKQYGNRRFQELKDELKVSSPTLSRYLKKLKDKIECFRFEGEDRRIKRYRIKRENIGEVESQLGRYEAIKFIEGISNPIYSYEQDKKGEKAIATFISSIDKSVDGLEQKMADQIVKQYLRFLKLSVLPNQKIAVVIMVKGKEGVEP